MSRIGQAALKVRKTLRAIPGAADLHWLLWQRNRPLQDRFRMETMGSMLPDAVRAAGQAAASVPPGREVLVFATLHYWIEQAAYLGLVLAGRGHRVTLATLPFADWRQEVEPFMLRQRELYIRDRLRPAAPLVRHVSWAKLPPAPLPAELEAEVVELSLYDTQYTYQIETVDPADPLYRLRLKRNRLAIGQALAALTARRPDVVLIPNGMVLELGAVYRAARHLGIPIVTYEFSETREEIWLAQDDVIMLQNTDRLWQACRSRPLTEAQWEQIRALESARQGARIEGRDTRQWQTVSSQGGEQARAALGLDGRPIALLATNVLGDSLVLGRDVFSPSMGEWIVRTMRWFGQHPSAQLVVRIHPGEVLMTGPSILETIRRELPEMPANVRVVAADQKINTYDLAEIAALGMVYTTTTGMVMAMRGLPVIVAAQTHFRGRGFTFDPAGWDEYFALTERILADPSAHRLKDAQIETAWNYAYRFFFEYPQPFPWRLLNFWEDMKVWPLERLLSREGLARFGRTLDYLAGEPLTWMEDQ